MSNECLYNLLPTVYQQLDLAQGQPLRALLGIMQQEYDGVEADITSVYNDLFIETCDSWAIPYIADLLGIEFEDTQSLTINQRARVANSLSYRSRKGEASVLEQIIYDVTGWYVHVVEFFQYLGITQSVQHLRPNQGMTALIRNVPGMALLNGPFDPNAHTVEVLNLSSRQPKYAVNLAGIFVWRLTSYPITSPALAVTLNDQGQAVPLTATDTPTGYYTFSPLALDLPLYNAPQPLAAVGERTQAVNLPIALQPEVVATDIEQASAAGLEVSAYYGPSQAFYIQTVASGDSTPVPVDTILITDLTQWTSPPAGQIAVDVNLGRIVVPADEIPAEGLQVSYSYAFSADLGGGPYSRQDTLVPTPPDIIVSATTPSETSGAIYVNTLAEALENLPNLSNQPAVLIEFQDSGIYQEAITNNDGTIAPFDLTFPSGVQTITIQAADGVRPTVYIQGQDGSGQANTLINVIPNTLVPTLSINGLLINGGLAFAGNLTVQLEHMTLVPTADSASVSVISGVDVGNLNVNIDSSILGALRLPKVMGSLSISNSIVDSVTNTNAALSADDNDDSGPSSQFSCVTVFGAVYVHVLTLASDSIFTGDVLVDNTQTGCMRYCSLPANTSVTPQRFRCQPDFGLQQWAAATPADEQTGANQFLVQQSLIPQFTSVTYGQPGYAQLSPYTSTAITTGAENGTEMGVFQSLNQPQQVANVTQLLQEYLPAGIQPVVLDVD
jgi:hypothetical protein